ncbi:MAG: photosystem II cytochrome c-550 [Cyanobacteria bacterium J06614_10]
MLQTIRKFFMQALLLYVVLVGCMIVFSFMNSAIAVDIKESLRTVPLNDTGEQVTLSIEQLASGQRKFNQSCAQCHLDGGSKTNPDVDLTTQTLANATPPRDSIEGLVNYLMEPTTYDGMASLAELHPSKIKADLFPVMKEFSQEDLQAIAGYILAEPKIVGSQWGGGKPKR